MQHTANVLTGKLVRGFESLPLRRKKLPNPKGAAPSAWWLEPEAYAPIALESLPPPSTAVTPKEKTLLAFLIWRGWISFLKKERAFFFRGSALDDSGRSVAEMSANERAACWGRPEWSYSATPSRSNTKLHISANSLTSLEMALAPPCPALSSTRRKIGFAEVFASCKRAAILYACMGCTRSSLSEVIMSTAGYFSPSRTL